MAQRLTTSFVSTNIPGAYPNVSVKNSPVGLGATGIIVIMGEADGGPSFQEVLLKDNSFTADQLSRVEQAYISGPIVDAMRALSAPSSDANIVGSASRIFISKTNQGIRASAIVDTDYGTLKSKNWGKDGNKHKYQITNSAEEVAPSLEGEEISAFGAPLNGLTFSIRLNGGSASVVTLSANDIDHATIADLINELNSLLPAGITASEGTIANSLKLEMDADANANRSGNGRSFELIETSPGDLAAIGLEEGLTVSSQEPSIEISIVRSDIGLDETLTASASIALMVGYDGTSATLTIDQDAKTLTTTVVGGSGSNLSIDLSDFKTIADLADFIAAQPGYSASVAAAAQQRPVGALDEVTAIGIAASGAGLMPGRIKMAADAFQRAMSTSSALDFDATAKAGLPSGMSSAQFLSGGAKGATTAANIVDAVNQLAGIQCNIIVPLFSRDASEDIADGLTESSSTYTIDAVHALVKNHCLQYSTPKLKRHRLPILSFWGDYADAKQKSQSLGHFRVSLTCQRSTQVNSAGEIVSYLPWYTAAVAAGMQAAGFYKAIVNKAANVISYEDPSGFDSGSPGDVEDALDAGLLILGRDTSRNYWISDQTTYGFDTNFVYNSLQAVYLSDIIALDLADSFQKAFVGQSLADVDAAVALSFLNQKMEGYKNLKMIAGSDDAPLGFKNAKVSISGPQMDVAVEIKLATAIYFIPIEIDISQVQTSAAGE